MPSVTPTGLKGPVVRPSGLKTFSPDRLSNDSQTGSQPQEQAIDDQCAKEGGDERARRAPGRYAPHP